MTKEERLKLWITGLSPDKKDELLLLCVTELIESELIKFYDGYLAPVWDCTGDPIDDSERSGWW